MSLAFKNIPILVQKYGGSSVADASRILEVAKLVQKRHQEGNLLCVVVSAMGKTTDQLLTQAHTINQNPSRRELDMLLSCGERASMALLAMALESLGVPSISLTGSQSGIITDDNHSGARILEVKPFRVIEALEKGKVVIIAGFQGVSQNKEITTLGRGGSDTTAIAMAAALGAEACEIYSDVLGVYTADPKIVPGALLLASMGMDEMENLARAGAKVLNAAAVQYAKNHNIRFYSRQTGSENPGTLVTPKTPLSTRQVTAIAHKDTLHCLEIPSLHLTEFLEQLHTARIKAHTLSKNPHTHTTQCIIYPEDAHGLEALLAQHTSSLGLTHRLLASVSLVGQDLQVNPLLAKTLHLLASRGIEVLGFHNNSNSLSFYLMPSQAHEALTFLHSTLIEHSETA